MVISKRLFVKGEVAQIINDTHPLFGEIVEIHSPVKHDQYDVKLACGQQTLIRSEDLVPWLGYEVEKKLYKAQLFQIQMLAVDTNDKEWFQQASKLIRELDVSPARLLQGGSV